MAAHSGELMPEFFNEKVTAAQLRYETRDMLIASYNLRFLYSKQSLKG